MQATLLIMCFVWRRRQHKLGLDDFGHPVHDGDERSFDEAGESDGLVGVEGVHHHRDAGQLESAVADAESTPLLTKGSDRDGAKSWLGWLQKR